MTLANSLGVPVHPRPKRRHGERHVIAAESNRCPHCRQVIRRNPIDAWGKVRAVLAVASGPLAHGQLVAATGLPKPNVSMALVHHAHEVTRAGERGSYVYALVAA